MQIALPGALPPSAMIATQLAQQLPNVAPTLFAWMCQATTHVTPFDPYQQGCTPFEGWQLTQAGFQPPPNQFLGAGLGPLRATRAAVGEKVWLADLAHIAIGLDHATLRAAQWLDVTAAQGTALFEAAQPLFQGTPFTADLLTPYRWRVQVPASLSLPTVSPEVMMDTALHNWWNQEVAARPWRHLMNEIQMVWHEHPVNIERIAQNQLPINGVWLYGGGTQWPQSSEALSSYTIIEDLYAPYLGNDWNGWLSTLRRLEVNIFQPNAGIAHTSTRPSTLILFGKDRFTTFTFPARYRLFRRLFYGKQDWKSGWFPSS